MSKPKYDHPGETYELQGEYGEPSEDECNLCLINHFDLPPLVDESGDDSDYYNIDDLPNTNDSQENPINELPNIIVSQEDLTNEVIEQCPELTNESSDESENETENEILVTGIIGIHVDDAVMVFPNQPSSDTEDILIYRGLVSKNKDHLPNEEETSASDESDSTSDSTSDNSEESRAMSDSNDKIGTPVGKGKGFSPAKNLEVIDSKAYTASFLDKCKQSYVDNIGKDLKGPTNSVLNKNEYEGSEWNVNWNYLDKYKAYESMQQSSPSKPMEQSSQSKPKLDTMEQSSQSKPKLDIQKKLKPINVIHTEELKAYRENFPDRVPELETDYGRVIVKSDPMLPIELDCDFYDLQGKFVQEYMKLPLVIPLIRIEDAIMLRKLYHRDEVYVTQPIMNEASGILTMPQYGKFTQTNIPNIYDIRVKIKNVTMNWIRYLDSTYVPAKGKENDNGLYDHLLDLVLNHDRAQWPYTVLPHAHSKCVTVEKNQYLKTVEKNKYLKPGVLDYTPTRMRIYSNYSQIYEDTPDSRMMDRLEDELTSQGYTVRRFPDEQSKSFMYAYPKWMKVNLIKKSRQNADGSRSSRKDRERNMIPDNRSRSQRTRYDLIAKATPLIALKSLVREKDGDWVWDNGASSNTTHDLKDLEQVRALTRPIVIEGIGGSSLKGTHSGKLPIMLPGINKCTYIEDSTFKLMSLGNILKAGGSYTGKDMMLTVEININGIDYISQSELDPQTNIHQVNLTDGYVFARKEIRALASMRKTIQSFPTGDPDKRNYSSNEILRANLARDWHIANCHPGKTVTEWQIALNIAGSLTTNCVKLMDSIYGQCPECEMAKLKKETLIEEHGPKPNRIGQMIGIDLREHGEGMGVIIFVLCLYSGCLSACLSPTKQPKVLVETLIEHYDVFYGKHGHALERVHTDAEPTLIAMEPFLLKHKVKVTNALPNHHNTKVEIAIQHIDRRIAATVAGMANVLPRSLLMYTLNEVMAKVNSNPNSTTYAMLKPTTPHQLRTGTHSRHAKDDRESAQIGQVYVIPIGLGAIKVKAKQLEQYSQLMPHGCLGMCLGSGLDPDLKGSLFIMENGKIVNRGIFHPMIHTHMKGFDANSNVGNYYRIPVTADLHPQPKNVKSNLSDIETLTKENETSMPKNKSRKQVNIQEENNTQLLIDPITKLDPNEESKEDLSRDDLEDLFQAYLKHNPTASVPLIQEGLPATTNKHHQLVIDEGETIEIPDTNPAPIEPRHNRYRGYYGLAVGLSRMQIWRALVAYRPGHFSNGSIPDIPDQCIRDYIQGPQHYSYQKAMSMDPILVKAADEKEQKKIRDNECFRLLRKDEKPPNKDDCFVIPVYFLIKKEDPVTGEFTKWAARLAVHGGLQSDQSIGLTASHTASMDNMNIARAAFVAKLIEEKKVNLLFCRSFDVVAAYLKVSFDEPQRVLCTFPHNFPGEMAGKLYKVVKAMYGLKKSGLLFEIEMNKCLTEAGFTALPSDPSIFIKKDNRGMVQSLLFMHVDDGQMLSIVEDDWSNVVRVCEKRFGEMTKRIPSTCHIGINITFEEVNGIKTGAYTLDQKGYALSMLKKLDPENKLVIQKTPSLDNLFINDETSPGISIKFMQTVIGMLVYLVNTRLDLKKDIYCMARRTSCPTEFDMTKVSRIIAYIKGTPGYGPRYFTTEGVHLLAFTDASHNVYPDSRSHSGHALYIGADSGPVTAYSKIQMLVIPLSATEAEYMELSNATKTILIARQILDQLGYTQEEATTIIMDCKSAVAMARSTVVNRKSGHIDLKYNHVKDLQLRGIVDVIQMSRIFQRIDFIAGRIHTTPEFTKGRNVFMNTPGK